MLLEEEIIKEFNIVKVSSVFVSLGLGGECKSGFVFAETSQFGQSDNHSLAQTGAEVSDFRSPPSTYSVDILNFFRD